MSEMNFDFDGAPQGGAQTLTDPQNGGSSDGGSQWSEFDDDTTDNAPKKQTKTRAAISKPNKWGPNDKGNSGIAINFTATEGDIAGYEAALFFTLKGQPSMVNRGKSDLAKLCRKLGLPTTGKTGDLVAAIAERAGEEVDVTYKPANNGGMFVNL